LLILAQYADLSPHSTPQAAILTCNTRHAIMCSFFGACSGNMAKVSNGSTSARRSSARKEASHSSSRVQSIITVLMITELAIGGAGISNPAWARLPAFPAYPSG
jgi:hypothetical protein